MVLSLTKILKINCDRFRKLFDLTDFMRSLVTINEQPASKDFRSQHFINRELGQLEFNQRVLAQAENASVRFWNV